MRCNGRDGRKNGTPHTTAESGQQDPCGHRGDLLILSLLLVSRKHTVVLRRSRSKAAGRRLKMRLPGLTTSSDGRISPACQGHGNQTHGDPLPLRQRRIRIPYPGFRFDYSRPSVLFIGCSFVMGHGLSYEDSFVGQFQNSRENPFQS